MSLLKRLLQALGVSGSETPPAIHPLIETIEDLAQQEGRTKELVTADLLSLAQERRQAQDYYAHCWERLTPREQQVAALMCLGYTNRQIARRLYISMSTVKTHVHHVLSKFDFKRRSDLQMALAEWDFSDWEKD
jgi:DNA-binding NarL/FixJ family response regulator